NLAAGDSLLHGPERGGKDAFDYGDNTYDKDAAASGFTYSTEDRNVLASILAPGQYDSVVGNPPYIVASDKALNARYREIYHFCKGKYALTVPFMERFFQLAKPGERAGWVGQITSNSFMKREFGVPIIESFLSKMDLRLVADTSGAYIPGHGTPTVIIIGRNHLAVHETVHAVLGIQGEPGAPDIPKQGLVWSSIRDHIDDHTFENKFVSITDLSRENLSLHPWVLTGGGTVSALNFLKDRSSSTVADFIVSIGSTAITGEDEGFILGGHIPPLARLNEVPVRPFLSGDMLRDHNSVGSKFVIYPYSPNSADALNVFMWPIRTTLANGLAFGKSRSDKSMPWYDYILPNHERLQSPNLIAYGFITTHPSFAMRRGNEVMNHSIMAVMLSRAATEDDHLRLLGTLNSSTACFWLKQNSHDKGRPGGDLAGADEPWERRFEFTGTTLQDFPLPAKAPLDRARRIDALAQQLSSLEPPSVIKAQGATRATIDAARTEHAHIRAAMIAEQEELDWEVYRNYGLIDESLTVDVEQLPSISPGERAFAIELARKLVSGEIETSWFSHHNHNFDPTTEIPENWPHAYRSVIARRLSTIESNPFIRLLEKPEYKRRWAGETWDTKLQSALKDWLLDRL
ncbi:BREX-2 system adenine-specific DNA-methyltransferase PglX, partial [Rhodococcoides fascians]|uniref:BREX-2 system adenine-specific DNA-methyltransferase PglX n=1 Tax=Rhodococcoides fascians TaxID=1828 RepID=UPI0037B7F7A6